MIKFKQVVQFRMSAFAESPSRTLLEIRDLTDVSDEPEEREGIHVEDFTINARADFNRLGVTPQEEIDVPFPAIHEIVAPRLAARQASGDGVESYFI